MVSHQRRVRPHLTSAQWRLGIALIYLLFTGCSLLTSPGAPPPTPIVIPFPTFTATPVAIAPATATPAAVTQLTPVQPTATAPATRPPRGTLTATLYYLDNGQVSRVVDLPSRYVIEQVTHEAVPISDFDVSLVHGRLVYVTDNQLVEFDPATGARVVKVTALPQSQLSNANNHLQRQISVLESPRYAPDGAQIAYIQGGLNLARSGIAVSVDPERLLRNIQWSNDRVDTLLASSSVEWSSNAGDLRVYHNLAWAPDGKKLVMLTGLWEGSLYTMYDLASASSVEIMGAGCCGWSWGSDSQIGWIASNVRVYGTPGLFLVDTESGIAQQLDLNLLRTAADDRALPVSVLAAYQPSDDTVHFWAGVGDWPTETYMVAEFDLKTNRPQWVQTDPPLRDAAAIAITSDVRWAPDGSGAVTILQEQQPGESSPVTGRLHWLPRDGSPPIDLGIDAQSVQWGR